MLPNTGLHIEDIKAVFIEEIEDVAGKLLDTFQDESRLFLRAVLPEVREVGPEDGVQAGIALKAIAPDIIVSPYVFRRICSNGAILAHVLDTQPVQQSEGLTTVEIEIALRAAIQRACTPDIFSDAVEQMRLAGRQEADLALSLMPRLSTLPRELTAHVADVVFNGWMRQADRTRFGLMNAITALARDTANPEHRWALEALGAQIGIPTLSLKRPLRPEPAHVTKGRVPEAV